MKAHAAYIYGVAAHVWAAQDGPPDMSTQVQAAWGKRFRRVNHFIELAMVGAKSCLAHTQEPPPRDCDIYIATEQGNVADVAKITEALFKRQESPMPLEFLNVPNNMAGFYVAQGLGLQSANLTIAHRAFPFETALDIAIFRLASSGKKNSRALVGGVEECAYPLDQHRQRMQLAMDTPLAEGSSWLYLGNTEMDNEELGIEGLGNEAQSNEKLDDEAQGNEEPANKQHALARCEWVKFFPEHDALLAFLQGLGLPSSTFLAGGYGLEEEQLNALATTLGIVNRYNGRSATPYHDTQCAYVIASFISEQQGQCLVYVNRDARDCYAGVCISTLAQE